MNGLSSIISGKKNEGSSQFISINPANREDILGTFANASLEECREACLQAKKGLEIWKKTPAPIRAGIISNFGKLIEKNKEALSQILTREMGKPIKEARGDVQEAIDTCYFFVSEGRRLYGQTVPSEMSNKELFTYRRPVGVFACITAGNFPFAVPSWYFIPALVCGNTCVWKPSEDTPYLSLVFAELLYAAGVPKDVFHVVFGSGPKTGADLVSLVNEGLIDKVGFTGSTEVGRHIGEICGRNLQTPCLELGGKNPLVVMPDANLDLVTNGILWSGFGTAGQRCTSLGNLIAHKSIKETLIKKIMDKVASIQIGNPTDENIFYGPMIGERFLNKHLENINTLIKSHHRVLTSKNGAITEQNKPDRFSGNAKLGFYAFPTIVDNVTENDAIYSTETFGPLFNILSFSDLDEAIYLSNKTGYGLSSSIYTSDIESAYKFRNEISAGMTSINNSTTGAEAHLPFGGNGKSGNGSRQSGIWVVDQFTKWQSVNWDMSGKLQLAQMDTNYINPTDYIVKF
ncbi:aldehyde dehydrogenase family protein [Silvanigrella paludirubra]|uniref:aldehyde dehydrogenase (NAD(+)) n=1 Tax=Silvanigrella paludirubra TaxID=2499159 RepID=A0A6N6VNP4_9BACT|nr:aldehyde dehydrogenase family protein [Silvanigrella paludirubra]KAB8036275.1 aldehyde dehydrogenase family protein [Silvanigrella paludirubra]